MCRRQVDQAERAIDVLARHHATWFQHPDLPSLTWMPGLDDPMVHTLKDTFAMGWPIFLQRYGTELPARRCAGARSSSRTCPAG